jgi:cytochrome P450
VAELGNNSSKSASARSPPETTTTARVDFRDPAFIADPYPAMARLRDEDPVHRLADGLWLVTGYDDVVSVLRGWDRFSSELGYGFTTEERSTRRMGLMASMGAGNAMSEMGPMMSGFAGLRVLIAADPPDHTTLRRLLSKPFAPRQIWSLEARVRDICRPMVDELLADAEGGEADLFATISYPLPVTVIAELLGIPAERRADFKRWSDALVGGMAVAAGASPQRDAAAVFEMFQFFNEVITDRRRSPGDDLISILVTDGESGAQLSTPEIIAFCVLLLVAGNETTTNLLGNLFRALFAHPDRSPSCATTLRWLTRRSRRRCVMTRPCKVCGVARRPTPRWAASRSPKATS